MAEAVSPKGRQIVQVSGDADAIHRRGTSIKNLGAHMIESATTLEALATGTDASAGESIEKLRNEVGEVYLELRLAGKRYQPSGVALIAYANDLGEVQQRMRSTVPSCLQAWRNYESAVAYSDEKRRAAWQAQSAADYPLSPTADTEVLQNQADRAQSAADSAEARANTAYDNYLDLAKQFDDQYDDWSIAFDAAASSLENATSGGVSDRPGDHFNRVLDVTLEVLKYAGMVLAVLAFVIGGPIIAVIGAVVAVLTLVLTIVAMMRDRPGVTGWDLAFAIVGVIPFGSLAKFSGGAKAGFVGMFDDMLGGLGTAAGRANFTHAVKNFGTTFQWGRQFGQGFGGALVTASRGANSMDDIAARIAGFGFGDELMRSGTGGWHIAGQVFGHYGWVLNTPGSFAQFGIETLLQSREQRMIDSWALQFAND